MNQRLIHDVAVAMAEAILDRVSPHLPYADRLTAIGDFYCICKAGVEAYCMCEQEHLVSKLWEWEGCYKMH